MQCNMSFSTMILSLLFLSSLTLTEAFTQSKSASNSNLLCMKAQVPKSYRDTNRNYFKSLISITTAASVLTYSSQSAKAGLFQSEEQDKVEELNKYQKPIFELLQQLRPTMTPNTVGFFAMSQTLKGGKEDSDVVLNYMETYIKPCQAKMAEAAPKLKLANPVDQTRLEVLPLLMKGHILELTQAIGGMTSAPQAKEVEECAGTLAEYLKLASVQYKVVPYLAPRAMMDAEYMGPFGCGFWGKRRMTGSNYCEDVPEGSKTKDFTGTEVK